MKKVGFVIGISFLLVSFYGYAGTGAKAPDGARRTVHLGAPSALKLVIVPDGFKVTWVSSLQDPGVVTGSQIVRSDSASGPFVEVAAVAKGTFQYIDFTASPETIFYYKVRAVAGTAYSPCSNTVTGER